jgi:hypothetical protein
MNPTVKALSVGKIVFARAARKGSRFQPVIRVSF